MTRNSAAPSLPAAQPAVVSSPTAAVEPSPAAAERRIARAPDTVHGTPLQSGETMAPAGNPRRISGSHSSRNRVPPFRGDIDSASRVLETALLITVHILDPV